jgi:tetrahydromethanopterin S-methyltransferase subunit G
MCSYSNMIGDWWHPTWPASPTPQPLNPSPNAIPWPTIQADPALAAQMLEVLKRLEAIDKRLDNIDCKVEKDSKKKITTKLKRIAKKKRSQSTSAVEPK